RWGQGKGNRRVAKVSDTSRHCRTLRVPRPSRGVFRDNYISSRLDRSFLGFADFHRAHAVSCGDDAWRSAGTDALEQVFEFADVAVFAFELQGSRLLAFLEQLERIGPAREVVVRRRVLQNHGVG